MSAPATWGASDTRGRLEVVDEQIVGQLDLGDERELELGAPGIELGGGPRETEPVGLPVDVGGREAERLRQHQQGVVGERGQRRDDLAGAGAERGAGIELAGDVGAELGGDLEHCRRRDFGELGRCAQQRGGVGRPAPHAGRDRDPLLDLDLQRRRSPPDRPQVSHRFGDQVGAIDAEADDLVCP